MTNYLICYDIREDDVRTTISDTCVNFGLVRIQYSVFFGQLERSQLKTLEIQLSAILNEGTGDIHIIKVCDSCEKSHQVLVSISDELELEDHLYEDVSDELEATSGVLIL